MTSAIEDETFPFESLSDIAEVESWRKEVYRPNYHLQKWWAQRLGSVFRALVLGAFRPAGSDIEADFYSPINLADRIVFDPFMGSGTTIGEAVKLGARAIGRDINPVAYFAVRNSVRTHSRKAVIDEFARIRHDVAEQILRFYRVRLSDGRDGTVLYFFWVQQADCPSCKATVDLFRSYVFAQHAYAAANPDAQAVCPSCGGINQIRYDATRATCVHCTASFDPSRGPARGAKASCTHCASDFAIAEAIRSTGRPPRHRLYAKLVLTNDGRKVYCAADESDREAYVEASALLKSRKNCFPIVPIEPGYNTDQVLKYGFTHWHQMFNDRQLLCIGILADRIRKISDPGTRDLLSSLFLGTLEFNNMFASYKGEGTGAVRHMFSHHILKPERVPIEANLWGTPKSSGSFSTLFESRILRALDYLESPFEVKPVSDGKRLRGEKVYPGTPEVGCQPATSFREFVDGARVYLSCGDSAATDIKTETVDAVITDPPFFDNVHYSQLADFFFVWLQHLQRDNDRTSTRSPAEVQQEDSLVFTERLGGVWQECHRVLKPDGLLIFTYHHSRNEGWEAVLDALTAAGFAIVAAHPIKAEMSVASPKQQAREPIDLDMILVCKKAAVVESAGCFELQSAIEIARHQIARLNRRARKLSRNDVRVIVMAQVIASLSRCKSSARRAQGELQTLLEDTITSLHEQQDIARRQQATSKKQQMDLGL